MTGIVYIHVPKCGGSSFGAALRMRYILSQSSISLKQGDPRLKGREYILSDFTARDAELKLLMDRKVKLISGHVRYSRALHQSGTFKYSFVTLLRDPVQRFVSHYNYLQRHHPNTNRPDTLDAFLDTEDAARIASQYLFYFSRFDQTMQVDTNRLVQRAIINLSRFDLVGDLSAPKEFARGLNRLSGGPLPIWRRNSAPNSTIVPLRLLAPISQLCAADIEIYNTVQSNRIAA